MNRDKELAKKIVCYSCDVKEKEKVAIQIIGDNVKPLVLEIISVLNDVGASVEIINREPSITAEIIKGITLEKAKEMAARDKEIIENADVCIMLKSIENENVMTEVPIDKKDIYAKFYRQVIDSAILETTRWISLRYPNKTMALNAGMSLSEYEDYFFEVCNIDYNVLSVAMDYLVELMTKSSTVKIVGPNTNIIFSIAGMPVHKCDGFTNLPDGEVYTAPIRDSINGYIKYNVSSIYRGTHFDGISFTFANGKIIEAQCDNSDNMTALSEILNADDGARFVGEFALGVNPFITHPTKDILFDEKIAGSFHLTPGFSYKDAFNGNESAIHWDLVCIQTEEYGGGEIYFDDVLIRKDGKFLLDELGVLNPK